MIPAPFDYSSPSTLEEALALLEKHGDEAKILAGGHSLIPMMKLRFASPEGCAPDACPASDSRSPARHVDAYQAFED